MKAESRKHLYDILRACELLGKFAEGKAFEDYTSDPLLRSGVERQFEIIGEALNRLFKTDPELAEGVPEGRRIIGFRNMLAHGYDMVDDRIAWEALQSRVPELHAFVKKLIGE